MHVKNMSQIEVDQAQAQEQHSDEGIKLLLLELEMLENELQRRKQIFEPVSYGLPDLTFDRGCHQGVWDEEKGIVKRRKMHKYERVERYEARQNRELKKMINGMWFKKDGKKKDIILIDEQFRLLCDFVFNREQMAVLWGPRGGGKSLTIALVIWFKMVYFKQSVVDMAGSGEQAQAVYRYAVGFFSCFPKMTQDIVKGDALKWRMHLKNGVTLWCAEGENKAVGKHCPGFVADEACLLPSTLVFTLNGVVPIENIRPNAEILGKNGDVAKVYKKIKRQYDGKILNFKPRYGHFFEVTEDHLVYAVKRKELKIKDEKTTRERRILNVDDVKKGKTSHRGSKGYLDFIISPKWTMAKELNIGDFICYPVPKFKDRKIMLPDAAEKSSRSFFSFLGHWVGDGVKDREERVYFELSKSVYDLNSNYFSILARHLFDDFKFTTDVCTQTTYYFNAKDVDLALWLHQFGYSNHGKSIPLNLIFSATLSELKYFLRAFVMSHAYIVQKNEQKYVNIGTENKNLAVSLFIAMLRLGILPIIQHEYDSDSQKMVYKYRLSSDYSRQILDKGCSNEKYSNDIVYVDENYIYCPLVDVEGFNYSGAVYDLEINKKEPSFTLLGGVVHNCTGSAAKDKGIARAMQGVFSEEDYWVVLLSTMHHPFGMFVDYWKDADELNYKKYKWNIFDTMNKCQQGIEKATEKDPKALDYCMNECVFTRYRKVEDLITGKSDMVPEGCCGVGRDAKGWQTFENVMNVYKANGKSELFWIEHACVDPYVEKYPYRELMKIVNKKDIFILKKAEKDCAVGIDWGLTQCFMVNTLPTWLYKNLGFKWDNVKSLEPSKDQIIGIEKDNIGIGVVNSYAMSNQLEDKVIEVLKTWTDIIGQKPTIYADASHPYCNKRIGKAGYKVIPIAFKKYRDAAVRNLTKWLSSGKMEFVGQYCDLLMKQMCNLQKEETDKIKKKSGADETSDHGPDALMLALLHYSFETWRPRLVKELMKDNKKTLIF